MQSKLIHIIFAVSIALTTGAIVFTLALSSSLGIPLTIMFSMLTIIVVLGMFLGGILNV
jgi:hypothetical protein